MSALDLVRAGENQQVLQALNRMTSELEKRQEQLLQARKLSSIGILTSGVAHQLNNPLNNISTSCQILLEEFGHGDPEFMHKMLTNIEQEVHRARDTVKGLLEFSRDKEFALVPHSLKEVVDRAVRLMSSQVPPGIDIVRDVQADMLLNLDAQRLQEVFLNLLTKPKQQPFWESTGCPFGENCGGMIWKIKLKDGFGTRPYTIIPTSISK
jgi:signal transduction histidine kinase